jgi:hypothetical protein
VSTVTATPAGPSIRTRVGEVLKNWGKKVPPIVKKAGNWFTTALKKSGGFLKKAGKWALEAKATQWVMDKAKPAWNKAWPIIKGPILWVATPVLVVLALPKVVLICLGALLVGLIFAMWRISRSRKKNAKTYTDAEWDAITDVIGHSKTAYTSTVNGQSKTEFGEMKITGNAKGRIKVYWRAVPDVVTTTPTSRFRTTHHTESEDQLQERLNTALGEAGNVNGLTLTGEPTAGETIALRYRFLDQQAKLAGQNMDTDLLSEVMGRMNLIEVRTGMTQGKIKADAKAQLIHGDLRQWLTETFPKTDWKWDLMYKAAVNESTRLKKLAEMQEELAPAS